MIITNNDIRDPVIDGDLSNYVICEYAFRSLEKNITNPADYTQLLKINNESSIPEFYILKESQNPDYLIRLNLGNQIATSLGFCAPTSSIFIKNNKPYFIALDIRCQYPTEPFLYFTQPMPLSTKLTKTNLKLCCQIMEKEKVDSREVFAKTLILDYLILNNQRGLRSHRISRNHEQKLYHVVIENVVLSEEKEQPQIAYTVSDLLHFINYNFQKYLKQIKAFISSINIDNVFKIIDADTYLHNKVYIKNKINSRYNEIINWNLLCQ